jgi:Holliday junction DNA helicase RuvA
MISSLRGTLIYNDTNSCVIECGGVGFKCAITSKTLGALPQKGEEVFLHTYMSVKEDAIDLFGFYDFDEMECFKMITSVSGVGAKIGIAMLSDYTPDKITFFIASELKLRPFITLDPSNFIDTRTLLSTDTLCAS